MTACEMRIIDWSSDVCSSDLYGHARPEPPGERTGSGVEDTAPEAVGGLSADRQERLFGALEALEMAQAEHPMDVPRTIDDAGRDVVAAAEITDDRNPLECRSEEHTSELQSLMRISYAVFCLKKTKEEKQQYNNTE